MRILDSIGEETSGIAFDDWKVPLGTGLALSSHEATMKGANMSSPPVNCAPPSAVAQAVQAYVRSINNGSAAEGSQVFDETELTTFIHPRGTERGWSKISADIYAFFSETFSTRALTLTGDPVIDLYGDTAVVCFEWDFVANFRDNGEVLHTSGRESQIYRNFPEKGWRIIHVHYSGPPVTGRAEGF